MDFRQIDRLAAKANKPLNDEWLEALQIAFGEQHKYYRWLYHLVAYYQPKVALEIGVHWGIGSAYMCAAGKTYGGQVIGIDIVKHNEYIIARLTNEYDYHFLHMDSTAAGDTVKALTSQYGPLGLVYQDSSHHYEASKREWELYQPLTGPSAIWLCDDITPDFHDPAVDPPGKGMVQYFEELPGEKKLFANSLHYGSTIGVVLL